MSVQRVRFRDVKRYEIVDSLDELAGPAIGTITLPVDVYWSGLRDTFDVTDERQRRVAYQAALSNGRREHIPSSSIATSSCRRGPCWPSTPASPTSGLPASPRSPHAAGPCSGPSPGPGPPRGRQDDARGATRHRLRPHRRQRPGADWRAYPPVTMDIGPVLDVRDSVGSKTADPYSRNEVRDYTDVAAIVLDGRWSPDEIIAMGANNDPASSVNNSGTSWIHSTRASRSAMTSATWASTRRPRTTCDALTVLRSAALGRRVDLENVEAARIAAGGRTEPLREQLTTGQHHTLGAPRTASREQGEEHDHGG